jgi:large subunit ribosomal protein L22
MQSTATLKFASSGPRKVRYVADMVRGEDVARALKLLQLSKRGMASTVAKLIRSAVANAESTGNADVDALYIKELVVDGGPIHRRWRPRAHGRATRIRKRTSHIRVVLDDER